MRAAPEQELEKLAASPELIFLKSEVSLLLRGKVRPVPARGEGRGRPGCLQSVRLSRQFSYRRILQPQVMDEVVEIVRDSHFVWRGVERSLVILPERPQRLLDIFSDLVQCWHVRCWLTVLPHGLEERG